MSKPKVYSRFDLPPSPSLECTDASLTRQEFVQECDLNIIMRRYAAGLPPSPPGSRPPLFGDFSNIPDYQTALDQVIDAQERFGQLPSAVRKRFDNDPAKLLAFLADRGNLEEAVKLGLVDKPKPADKPADSKPADSQSPKGADDSARARTT